MAKESHQQHGHKLKKKKNVCHNTTFLKWKYEEPGQQINDHTTTIQRKKKVTEEICKNSVRSFDIPTGI